MNTNYNFRFCFPHDEQEDTSEKSLSKIQFYLYSFYFKVVSRCFTETNSMTPNEIPLTTIIILILSKEKCFLKKVKQKQNKKNCPSKRKKTFKSNSGK